MAQFLSFASPLSLADCVQRLQDLAAQKEFLKTVGRSTVKIKIDSIVFDHSNSKSTFKIHANNSLYTRFPIRAFYKLSGEIQGARHETRVQGLLEADKVFLTVLAFLVFWGIVVGFALIGIISRGLALKPGESVLIVVAAVLVSGLGYVWSLYRAYKTGLSSIPSLVYQALGSEPMVSAADRGSPDWIGNLS